ncbi:ATP-binding protein [Aliiroseovarius subalbicans]|uniref:sensor histidine kinase n=1 Tax=Aliiroseovarius subalbicans TaxID=2925840 RepID=UPI001F57FFD6|nr:ATP-binding protein [uncultured Aliiroseovarius sp.]MCI2399292.1 HAMP domain-containing histidine kinase [Aliiroseovarius subalbicans]
MVSYKKLILRYAEWNFPDRLKHSLEDYTEVTFRLLWQRQILFLSALLITSLYFDPVISIACYALVLFSEGVDLTVAVGIRNWQGNDPKTCRKFLLLTLVSTLVSATAICTFILAIAFQQENVGHFTPLFFLLAASLFASMNNHKLPVALALRLTVYAMAFVIIAFLDVVRFHPPLTSPVWLNFFTILFALQFAIRNSLGFLRMYKNIKRQMNKLEREHQRTRQALEAKSQFVSTVSHELRTPLTSIRGSLELVLKGLVGEIPEQAKSILEVANRNSVRLAHLIDDLLDLQKIESDELTFHFENLNLGNLILDCVAESAGFATLYEVEIDTKLPDEDVFVSGDEVRLQQVLSNLLSNAIKFSARGQTVEVCLQTQNGKATTYVKDSGIGIPDNAKEVVFERFSQVDSSDTRKAGGTGLGLHISKMIVEKHNGTIDYTSRLGEGTTFKMELELF